MNSFTGLFIFTNHLLFLLPSIYKVKVFLLNLLFPFTVYYSYKIKLFHQIGSIDLLAQYIDIRHGLTERGRVQVGGGKL